MPEHADRALVYASCTESGFEVLRRLHDKGFEISVIVSLTPSQAEANHVSGYFDFEEFAKQNDIPIYYPEEYSMSTDRDLDHFESLSADLMIVNGWQRLVPGAILETFPYGALGVHGSAYGLPKGRGRSPLNWSLIEDLDRFLLSVIRLDSGVDSGDLVDTKKFEINDHDNIRTLYYKTAIATQRILTEHLPEILSGEYEFQSQSGEPTYYPKRNPDDGGIHWQSRTADIHNLVRAVTRPYPGAFTCYEEERIYVWEAQPFSYDYQFDAEPGEIVQVFELTGDFVVKGADGTLLITDWGAESWQPKRGQVLDSVGTYDRVDEEEP